MQDTDQEQPIIQLETSDDYIAIFDRNRKDIIANEYVHSLQWETLRQRNRWSNSLDIDTSEARDYVPKGWKPSFHLTEIGSITS